MRHDPTLKHVQVMVRWSAWSMLVEQPHYIVVHPLRRHVSRQALHVVRDLSVGVRVQQCAAGSVAPLARCEEEGRLVLDTHIGFISNNKQIAGEIRH